MKLVVAGTNRLWAVESVPSNPQPITKSYGIPPSLSQGGRWCGFTQLIGDRRFSQGAAITDS